MTDNPTIADRAALAATALDLACQRLAEAEEHLGVLAEAGGEVGRDALHTLECTIFDRSHYSDWAAELRDAAREMREGTA